MAILWCGGEDIDFPTKSSSFTQIATGQRTSYARACIGTSLGNNTLSRSASMGAALATLWASCRVYKTGTAAASTIFFGLGINGTLGGLILGIDSATASKMALWKANAAGALSQLAAEAVASFTTSVSNKYDILVESFGATGRVRVYANGASSPIIDYSGDLTWTGATTGLDQFIVAHSSSNSYLSECIIADEDTRAMSLVTLAPSAAGDANNFDSGTYANLAETTPFLANDSTILTSSTTGQAAQFALNDLPSGTFTVKAVKVGARATCGSTGITKIKMGVKTNSTINVDAGHTLSTAWADAVDRLMQVNPVTGVAWTTNDVNALQLALESLT